MIFTTFLDHAGFRVLLAPDGESGVAIAGRERPDLILMDIAMPVLDGLSATRQLKADARTARIPVFILTAHALEGDRARSLEAGADAYFSKPIEPRVIRDAIVQHLTRARLSGAGGDESIPDVAPLTANEREPRPTDPA